MSKKAVTIITEGCNEEYYFNSLIMCMGIKDYFALDYQSFDGGSPKMAYDKYVSLLKDKDRDNIQNYLVILDTDKSDFGLYTKKLYNENSTKNIFVFGCEPCFEGFLLEHFVKEEYQEIKNKCNTKELITQDIKEHLRITKGNNISICEQCEKFIKYKEYIRGYTKNCQTKIDDFLTLALAQEMFKINNSYKELLKFIKTINSK